MDREVVVDGVVQTQQGAQVILLPHLHHKVITAALDKYLLLVVAVGVVLLLSAAITQVQLVEPEGMVHLLPFRDRQ